VVGWAVFGLAPQESSSQTGKEWPVRTRRKAKSLTGLAAPGRLVCAPEVVFEYSTAATLILRAGWRRVRR